MKKFSKEKTKLQENKMKYCTKGLNNGASSHLQAMRTEKAMKSKEKGQGGRKDQVRVGGKALDEVETGLGRAGPVGGGAFPW